jgi:TonB family protein
MIKHLFILALLLHMAMPANCQPGRARSAAHMPGGSNALDSFVRLKLRYPEAAREASIEGRSVVRFLVDEKGAISQIEIIRTSGSPLLDEEAKRIVGIMPKWIPGTRGKRIIRTYFVLPVMFRLND